MRMLLATTVEPRAGLDLTDVDVLAPLVVVPRFAETKQALAGLGQVRTVALTSAHAVDALVGALFALGHDVRALFGIRLAAVGEGTAERLARHGLRADLTGTGDGAQLAAEIIAASLPAPVLHPRALHARTELADALTAAGIAVQAFAAYETHPDAAAIKAALLRHHEAPYDGVAFTSPRGVQALHDVFQARLRGCRLAAIGATTARALTELELGPVVVPDHPSLEALLASLRELLSPST